MNSLKGNFSKFTLTAFTCLILAACGSSGGGGSNKENQPTANTTSNAVVETGTTSGNTNNTSAGNPTTTHNTPTSNTASVNNATPSNTSSSNNNVPNTNTSAPKASLPNNPTSPNTTTTAFNGVTGTGFIINRDRGNIIKGGIARVNDNDVNTLITETGVRLTLLPSTATQPEVYQEKGVSGKKLLSGTNYQYTRWGYIEDIRTNKYLVGQGRNSTATMPSGTAIYKGHGVHLMYNPAENTNNIAVESIANFTADFTNKSLTGKLIPSPNTQQFDQVDISASISGNTFEGQANGVAVKGGFYGPQAEELTGSYVKDKAVDGFLGVFGAIKQ